jgi:hypothetical protein
LQIRTAGETVLDPKLLKLPIIKGSKCRRQSAKSSDQLKLSGSDVGDELEARLLRKREYSLGFTLHINKRLSGREKVRRQMVAAGRVDEVAHLIRCL